MKQARKPEAKTSLPPCCVLCPACAARPGSPIGLIGGDRNCLIADKAHFRHEGSVQGLGRGFARWEAGQVCPRLAKQGQPASSERPAPRMRLFRIKSTSLRKLCSSQLGQHGRRAGCGGRPERAFWQRQVRSKSTSGAASPPKQARGLGACRRAAERRLSLPCRSLVDQAFQVLKKLTPKVSGCCRPMQALPGARRRVRPDIGNGFTLTVC